MVLKGLLSSGDPDALAAAIAERQFLAQVESTPLIVEIITSSPTRVPATSSWSTSAASLKQILKRRMAANSGAYDALPVDQALAFLLEVCRRSSTSTTSAWSTATSSPTT